VKAEPGADTAVDAAAGATEVKQQVPDEQVS
jgi:hypothetical protein